MRVLVVDDGLDNLELFSAALEMWGHDGLAIQDATLALPKALEFLPDIAFLDLAMPDIDGFEVARRMRQHKALDHTFLVAVTGYGRAEDRERSQAAGFDVHLLKPIDFAVVQSLSQEAPTPGTVPATPTQQAQYDLTTPGRSFAWNFRVGRTVIWPF